VIFLLLTFHKLLIIKDLHWGPRECNSLSINKLRERGSKIFEVCQEKKHKTSKKKAPFRGPLWCVYA